MCPTTGKTIRIGVSSCLLGQPVRYDGGHRHDSYVTDTLGGFFELVPVCPEVEVGMGTPREPIRLEGAPTAPDLIAPGSGRDWTREMGDWSRDRARGLAGEDLCGFVFKTNSPSCGLSRVPVIQENGQSLALGQGFFAAAFVRAHPLVPVAEEGRLSEASQRENFLARVFAYHRLREVFAGNWQIGAAVDFHRREKYLLIAHSPKHHQDLDRLVACIADFRPAAFRDQYQALYMGAFSVKATTQGHLDALQRLAGHLQGKLTSEEQRRMIEAIEDFGAGRIPLTEPVILLRRYIEGHGVTAVEDQSYLNPH